jgi:hypothetical protein
LLAITSAVLVALHSWSRSIKEGYEETRDFYEANKFGGLTDLVYQMDC